MIARILSTVPRPARLFLVLAAADTLLFSLLRGAFALAFAPPGGGLPAAVFAKAFLLGAKFDARLAVLVALPLLRSAGCRRSRPSSGAGARRGWAWYLAASHLLLFFVYAVDFGYYAYAASRVNVTILQFLYNPDTSARMVWESYPVVRRRARSRPRRLGRSPRLARLLLARAEPLARGDGAAPPAGRRVGRRRAPRRRRPSTASSPGTRCAGPTPISRPAPSPRTSRTTRCSTSPRRCARSPRPTTWRRCAPPTRSSRTTSGIADPDPARLVYARRAAPAGSPLPRRRPAHARAAPERRDRAARVVRGLQDRRVRQPARPDAALRRAGPRGDALHALLHPDLGDGALGLGDGDRPAGRRDGPDGHAQPADRLAAHASSTTSPATRSSTSSAAA